MREFKFYKDQNNRWYIDLPEWDGYKEDLEMVCGADLMLDIAAQGEGHAYLTISTEELDSPRFVLKFNKEDMGGAWYYLKSDLYEFELWLCYVTKFVFDGTLPKTLYLK